MRANSSSPIRCRNCDARDIVSFGSSAFWIIAIMDAVVLAVGIVGYLALDPGPRPTAPGYRPSYFEDVFQELNEPLPENWQQFLPPGVEDLGKKPDGIVERMPSIEASSFRLTQFANSPYHRAIEQAKKEAKRHAFEQRKLQRELQQKRREVEVRQWQERDRWIDRLKKGVLLGTSLIVIVLTLAARRFWIVSRARSLFCWNCGQAMQRQEKRK